MRHFVAACFAFVAFIIPTFASAATYDIDPAHSSFNFKVRHLTVSNVTGTFGKELKRVRSIMLDYSCRSFRILLTYVK